MKKITLFLTISILLTACSININFNKPKETPISQANKKAPTQTIEPVQTLSPVQTPIPTPKPPIKDQLTNYFVNKFNKNPSDANLTISKNTGTHASGGITFQGEMGGGMWLAYKDNDGNWIVVFDGNGTIPCTSVEPHNFPASIITECWDDANSKIKYL
jgi:hypothetical protein